MPLEPIKVYEIEITGHLTIQAPNDTKALKAARDYVAANVTKLGFALTQHDGFAVVPEPTPPP